MRKLALLCTSLCAMVLLFSASPVRAQQWVGPNGNDANACTQLAPCASFQRAINVGASQINCLGSGSYGPVIITASLTIDCGAGNVGNVNVSGTSNSGITINTASAATIVLRHLALNGLSTGIAVAGITATSFSSGTLIVEDCMIYGFGGSGIAFNPSGGRGLLLVSNSQLFQNTFGIVVQPGSGQIASVTLNKVELVANNVDGLFFGGSGVVAGTMRDSVVGENGNNGVIASAGQVFFTVEESSIVDNLANGIATGTAGSAIKVGASTIGGNGTGILASAGSIVSFGNNQISDNGSDGNFTSTKPLK